MIILDNNASNAHNVQLQDMSDQELEFAKMTREISPDHKIPGKEVFRMYLEYCPDAVTYLLDRCLVPECNEQVLFDPKD